MVYKVGFILRDIISKADGSSAKRLKPKKGTNWNSQQQGSAFFEGAPPCYKTIFWKEKNAEF